MSIDHMIASCNNFFTFWQLTQDLMNPMLEEGIATEDEIQDHFNQRTII